MRARHPTADELPLVAALVAACDLADLDYVESSAEDIREEWERPGFDLARDAWVVPDAELGLAGYAVISDRAGPPLALGYVHPDRRGRGVGSILVERTEEWARKRGRPGLANGVLAADAAAVRLLRSRGYHRAFSFFRMAIELETPPRPSWPEGIEVRTFGVADAERVHAAIEEAFADEGSYVPEDLSAWRTRRINRVGFDPNLWFLALERGEIAGCALCSTAEAGGFVNELGVRRPWRGRGLGRALLEHAFAEFFRRGTPRVLLGVNTENPTGATRLYERAGMHVVFRFDRYEKALS